MRPSDLEIVATFPGAAGLVIESSLEKELEKLYSEYENRYGRRPHVNQLPLESLQSKHIQPLDSVARALKLEIGEEMALKIGEEYTLAREIAKRPKNKLGKWGGLYVTSALFLEHHRAQHELDNALYSCTHERDRINKLNTEHAARLRLAQESGNTYLANGLRVAPKETPTYPIARVIDAARDIIDTNAKLMPGFESAHKIEPTRIRSVDQVLSINGLLARPQKSLGDESALSAYVKRLFGGKSR
jgi:hypothetical protein